MKDNRDNKDEGQKTSKVTEAKRNVKSGQRQKKGNTGHISLPRWRRRRERARRWRRVGGRGRGKRTRRIHLLSAVVWRRNNWLLSPGKFPDQFLFMIDNNKKLFSSSGEQEHQRGKYKRARAQEANAGEGMKRWRQQAEERGRLMHHHDNRLTSVCFCRSVQENHKVQIHEASNNEIYY